MLRYQQWVGARLQDATSAIQDAEFDASVAEAAVFLKPAVRTIPEVIDRLEEISRCIGSSYPGDDVDGLACFNYLYMATSQRTLLGVHANFFDDNEFVSQLEVTFANRYFDALRASVTGESAVPKSWNALLASRHNELVSPMQFVLAGVNSHINLDLPVAVVDTCTALRTHPKGGSQLGDYQKMNAVFSEEMQHLRREYDAATARSLQDLSSPSANLVGSWSVSAARNAAWNAALSMWSIRRRGDSETPFVDSLDKKAAMIGELLLTPGMLS